jgi:hypothetical protein
MLISLGRPPSRLKFDLTDILGRWDRNYASLRADPNGCIVSDDVEALMGQ